MRIFERKNRKISQIQNYGEPQNKAPKARSGLRFAKASNRVSHNQLGKCDNSMNSERNLKFGFIPNQKKMKKFNEDLVNLNKM